ncbi:MAG TPA: dihydropteroate synthase [Chthoniobacterales bacterium]|jgi:dihydropteroate synthase
MTSTSWKIGDDVIDLTNRALVMGVLNVTPDSFSDGGKFSDLEAAVRHASEMARNGADIIDVGGESTRPGAEAVSPNEELERVAPVLRELARALAIPLSIDTSKVLVARAAIEASAKIINDVTGGRGDAGMFDLAAECNRAIIIVHMQGTPATMQLRPTYDNVVSDVANFFAERFKVATKAGIDPARIAFDPGIGFGKTVEHNLELLANLARLRVRDRPLVVGVSRKSFLGKITGGPFAREDATVAMTSLLRERGADVLRVHDVAPNVNALRTTEALLAASR